MPPPAGVDGMKLREQLADTAIADFARAAGIDDVAERIVTRYVFGPRDFDHSLMPGSITRLAANRISSGKVLSS